MFCIIVFKSKCGQYFNKKKVSARDPRANLAICYEILIFIAVEEYIAFIYTNI